MRASPETWLAPTTDHLVTLSRPVLRSRARVGCHAACTLRSQDEFAAALVSLSPAAFLRAGSPLRTAAWRRVVATVPPMCRPVNTWPSRVQGRRYGVAHGDRDIAIPQQSLGD